MTAREYLFGLEITGIKLGLEQIRALIRALDHPDLAYPSIVVAGTNGKGSVTAMIERGLRDDGYRTGRYTSPHLTHIEERIALDGVPVTARAFDRLAERVRDAAAALPHPPSFFEATTALALEAFREAAAACSNIGTYPVLVGDEGQRDCMLSSPIILYDYPQIAAESPGNLYDGTEIDEILTLRIMTLTDEEKREMRGADERARQILERTPPGCRAYVVTRVPASLRASSFAWSTFISLVTA